MRRSLLAIAVIGCALAAMPSSAAGRGYLTQWGCGGQPRSVAVPQSGEPVYVGDNQKVTLYTASGQLIRAWETGPPGPLLSFPSVSPSSNGFWVGNSYPFASIWRWSLSGPVAGYGSKGTLGTPGWFHSVWALVAGEIVGREVVVIVAIWPSGNAWSVQAFDADGAPLGHLDPPLESRIVFGEIAGVTIAGGVLWVIDNPVNDASAGGRLVGLKLSYTDGKLTVAQATSLRVNGARLGAIAPAPGGLWVRARTFAGNVGINKFNFSGGQVGENYTDADVPGGLSNSIAGIAGGADRYAGIAGDSSGNVYLADPGWGRVVKLGPAGALPATGGGNGTPRLDNCYQGPPVNQRTEPSAVGAPPSGARSLGPGWFLPRRLNPLAQRSARLGFSCSDPCGATLRGTLIAGRKRFVLKPAHRTIYQAGTASLTLRIPRRAITIARRSLRRGRRVTLALRLNVKSFETGLSYRSAARLRLTRNGARIAAAGDQRVIAMRRR